MDLILSKLAAKSTGSTDPFYPMMLKPGTVFIPPQSNADAKPDLPMTSSSAMTSSQDTIDNVDYQNEDDMALAIVNDDIEVQTVESCQSEAVKVEIRESNDVIADDVLPIETIPNDVVSDDVTEIQIETVKMEYDDAIDQPTTSAALIQSESSKPDDQSETFFIGGNESGLDLNKI